jgi:hypothetical protein
MGAPARGMEVSGRGPQEVRKYHSGWFIEKAGLPPSGSEIGLEAEEEVFAN